MAKRTLMVLLLSMGTLSWLVVELVRDGDDSPALAPTEDQRSPPQSGLPDNAPQWVKDAYIPPEVAWPKDRLARYYAKTEQIAADPEMAVRIQRAARPVDRNTIVITTIEDAQRAIFLTFSVAGVAPTKWFEHAGFIYFSGGTDNKPISDFSSGVGFRKGSTTAFYWLDLPR